MRVSNAQPKGFTLIELVVGMLVLAVALVMLSTMLFPQADRAADTLFRVRSAELGHSIMNEIWGKRYDDNTSVNGGKPCGSLGVANCTRTPGFEAGESDRDAWDDIDDYNDMTQNVKMLDSDQTYAEIYPGYQVLVTVGTGNVTRLITVKVTTPAGEPITFNAVRSNY